MLLQMKGHCRILQPNQGTFNNTVVYYKHPLRSNCELRAVKFQSLYSDISTDLISSTEDRRGTVLMVISGKMRQAFSQSTIRNASMTQIHNQSTVNIQPRCTSMFVLLWRLQPPVLKGAIELLSDVACYKQKK